MRPGDKAVARLHLPLPLPLVIGDRYVLRDDGRGETIGGGEILDIDPVAPAAHARPTGDVSQVIAERGSIEVDHLEAITGKRLEPTVGRWVIAPEKLAATKASIANAIRAAGPIGLDIASLDPLCALCSATWTMYGSNWAGAHTPSTTTFADHPYVTAVEPTPSIRRRPMGSIAPNCANWFGSVGWWSATASTSRRMRSSVPAGQLQRLLGDDPRASPLHRLETS